MGTSQRDPATASPLLNTKLYPPRWRPGLIPRPRLIERLERGAQSRLTLVAAPAGSGKTTLLGEWLALDPDRTVAWLSLDPADSDPVRFWEYVIAALRSARPDVGAAALAMLQSPQPPAIEAVLTALLNELHDDDPAARPLLLVLDDFHVIESAAIQEAIAFVVDHLPPSLRLVIASRADPALPLARLRGKGELTEIRAADLRFTTDEAAAFLNDVTGLGLSAADVAALEERTEGWIAGLQLAALSMQGRDDAAGFIAAFTGDDRYIVDYLVEEVLQRQPAPVRDFLLRTAILDRLIGPLCDAVTGGSNGAATLESLERANLFVVPLDDRREWYRYHHLFAEVLRAHLRREAPERVPELHRAAGDWYARHGEIPDAIRHAIEASDFARAAALVESIALEMVRGYRPLELLAWLRRLPDEAVRARPVLGVYYAFALFPAGEMDAAEQWLRDAEEALADGVAPPPATPDTNSGEPSRAARELRALPGMIALARAYRALATGDVAGTIAQTQRALERLPEDEHTWRGGAALLLALSEWALGDLDAASRAHASGVASLERSGDVPLAVSALFDAARLARERGLLGEATQKLEAALRLAHPAQSAEPEQPAGGADMPGTADAHLGLCEVAIERGELDAAERHLAQAEELAGRALLPETPSRLHVARACLYEARDDHERALAEFDEAERTAVPGPVPQVPVHALRVRSWLRQGRLRDAQAWVDERGLSADDEPGYALEAEHIALARVRIAQTAAAGDRSGARDALALLERLLAAAAAGGRTGTALEVLVLQALAHQALGDVDAALPPLGEALALAEPEGYMRLFTAEGEPMRQLLRRAIAAGISTAYAGRLLDALGPGAPEGASGGAELPEPLTAREVEILRLIAAGMRNQQIADDLVISVATVKRHIANAYGKLGVSHRTEAVARANELRLI